MKRYTIKEFSQITGLSTHTLRYYEKIGLLDPVPRNTSGYRDYSEDQLRQVEFLKRLRDTGMPIQKMMEYAHLRKLGKASIVSRRQLLQEHEKQLIEYITDLENNLQMIQWKIAWYKNEECKSGDGLEESNMIEKERGVDTNEDAKAGGERA